MSELHRVAAKKRWEGISVEERVKKMRRLGKLRQKQMSERQKKSHSRMMHRAKKIKNGNI